MTLQDPVPSWARLTSPLYGRGCHVHLCQLYSRLIQPAQDAYSSHNDTLLRRACPGSGAYYRPQQPDFYFPLHNNLRIRANDGRYRKTSIAVRCRTAAGNTRSPGPRANRGKPHADNRSCFRRVSPAYGSCRSCVFNHRSIIPLHPVDHVFAQVTGTRPCTKFAVSKIVSGISEVTTRPYTRIFTIVSLIMPISIVPIFIILPPIFAVKVFHDTTGTIYSYLLASAGVGGILEGLF